MINKPTPGSDAALDAGCRCPVIDNAHGRGFYIDPAEGPQYVINCECPMHGVKATKGEEESDEDDESIGEDPDDPRQDLEPGCHFPDKCVMPGFHLKGECHTSDMIEDHES